MTAFNVVKMRVKAEYEADFVAMNAQPGHEVRDGLRNAWIIKTGICSYCFIGEWESMEAIVAARPDMIAELDRMRHMLEEMAPGLGVTDAVSGEVIATG